MVKRSLVLSLILASSFSCSSRTPPSPAVRDGAQEQEIKALPTAAAATPPKDADAGPTLKAAKAELAKPDLPTWLRAHMPKGGTVVDGETPRVTHTVQPGDTYGTIAAAYLAIAEIYAPNDFAAAIQKKNPTLGVGKTFDIPEIVKSVPKDPKDDRLGWPEDKILRGVFVTGAYAQIKWVEILDKVAARGMNAVVLDAKDYMGGVNYPTKAKIALETGAGAHAPIPDLARAIRFAHARGIRVITRIPCFHDPVSDKKLKDGRLSLRFTPTKTPIHIDWIDPTNDEAQEYAVELARECVEAGADEVQLDYVRFPVHIGQSVAVMPDPRDRSNIIRDFVKRVHAVTKPAGAMLSLDLFGVTATGDRGDIERLGQDIAIVSSEAEAISPMVYPSHYDKGFMGWDMPGDHPEIVGIGTKAAIAQLKRAKLDTVVRSWLQAFPWKTTNYGSKYVVDQAKSAENNGGTGWLMWSPGCEYSAVWGGFPPTSKDPSKK